ncbi:MAG: ribonuclease HII, partial [Halanaeroarchaeum sp.]
RIDDPETDMNTLTVDAHVDALAQVVADGHRGVVDAGDTSETRFENRVADGLDADVTVEARHGADADDPLVAAASVIAKVERDAHVAALAERHDAPLGSGYPSDETTLAFLADYVGEKGELPPCARRTWSTSQRVLAEHEQAALRNF